MATLTLTLKVPDRFLDIAKANLSARGHEQIEDYVLSALQALWSENEPINDELEAQLLEGLDSPVEEMTDAEWDELHQRIEIRRQKK